MDREEIRYLLGSTVYARAKAYENRVQDLECETAENGVRHLSADVRGSGRNLYRTQAWLRQNGSFVSASCTCPFNENGEGPCCKHIGALLLHEVDEPEERRSQTGKEGTAGHPGRAAGTEFAKEAAAGRIAMSPASRCCSAGNGEVMNLSRMCGRRSFSEPIRRTRWPRWRV